MCRPLKVACQKKVKSSDESIQFRFHILSCMDLNHTVCVSVLALLKCLKGRIQFLIASDLM